MWKKVDGYTDYEVSDDGKIRSLKNGIKKLLTPHLDGKKNYYQVGLSKNGSVKIFLLHRLIAKAFIDNPENKKQVNHKNLNKKDNRVCNLEWCTHKENINHAKKNGVMKNPPTFKGKFGKNHNKSIGYVLLNPSGKKEIFYSGREFCRKTGLDNSNLTYASIHSKNKLPHRFKKGKMKGYVLLEIFKSYKNKDKVKEI